MPSKGKSMVAISSKTSACKIYAFDQTNEKISYILKYRT